MSLKTTLKWVWNEMGRSDKARRRNAFILIVLILAVIAFGFHSGAISIALQKALQ